MGWLKKQNNIKFRKKNRESRKTEKTHKDV